MAAPPFRRLMVEVAMEMEIKPTGCCSTDSGHPKVTPVTPRGVRGTKPRHAPVQQPLHRCRRVHAQALLQITNLEFLSVYAAQLRLQHRRNISSSLPGRLSAHLSPLLRREINQYS